MWYWCRTTQYVRLLGSPRSVEPSNLCIGILSLCTVHLPMTRMCFTMSWLVVQGRGSCLTVHPVIRVSSWLFVPLTFLITFSESVQSSQPTTHNHGAHVHNIQPQLEACSYEWRVEDEDVSEMSTSIHSHSHFIVDIESLLCVDCDQGSQVCILESVQYRFKYAYSVHIV